MLTVLITNRLPSGQYGEWGTACTIAVQDRTGGRCITIYGTRSHYSILNTGYSNLIVGSWYRLPLGTLVCFVVVDYLVFPSPPDAS